MATVKRSALVMHSAEQMYSLVNDVSSYPEFMDGCIGVEVFEHSDTSMLARLDLKKAGVKISFMTRNKLRFRNGRLVSLSSGAALEETPLSFGRLPAIKVNLSTGFRLRIAAWNSASEAP